MPVFKIWNADRSVKKAVIAETLQQLITKGASKLNIDGTELSVVLEEDGTVIDDDEVLQELGDKVFLLLETGQAWTSHQMTLVVQDQSSFEDFGPASTSTPNGLATASDILDVERTCFTVKSESDASANDIGVLEQLRRAPLPTFSSEIMPYLRGERKSILGVWKDVVAEAANYYLHNLPEFKTSDCYGVIGRKMYRAYPVIGLSGINPWTCFSTNLSQKMRHLRFHHKAKSQLPRSSGAATHHKATKRQRLDFSLSSQTQMDNANSDEDLKRHQEELQKEWNKPNGSINKDHVKQLLKETRQIRLAYLRENQSNGGYAFLFRDFPCFRLDSYILHEFSLMNGLGKHQAYCEGMAKCVISIMGLMGSMDVASYNDAKYRDILENPTQVTIDVIKYLEKRLKMKKSIIEELKDVPDSSIISKLATRDLEPPRIRIFFQGDEPAGVYVVGDGVYTEVQEPKGFRMLLTLLGSYYCFDICYPKQFLSTLLVLDTFMSGAAAPTSATQAFRFVLKELEEERSKMTI
ncbi:hypothetical protein V1264_011823 [Littorina saxatilis]|uniref:CIDE-N domain-containing protein n=1 Tax=Littorina saxatilis TaxID=31220 RepID=A0AAN9GLC3_9CAEN